MPFEPFERVPVGRSATAGHPARVRRRVHRRPVPRGRDEDAVALDRATPGIWASATSTSRRCTATATPSAGWARALARRAARRVRALDQGRPAGPVPTRSSTPAMTTSTGRRATAVRTPTTRTPPAAAMVFDYSDDGVMRSVEESLERLGLDRDRHPLHPRPRRPLGGGDRRRLPGARTGSREQGVVRAIGVGMNQSAMLARFARETDMDAFLARRPLHAARPGRARPSSCRCAWSEGIAVLVGGVMNSGVLADPRPGAALRLRRRRRPRSSSAPGGSRAACERHGVPLRAAAIQFPLAHPAVAGLDRRRSDASSTSTSTRRCMRRADPGGPVGRAATRGPDRARGADAGVSPRVVDAHHHLWDPTRADYPWMTDGPRRDPTARSAPDDLAPELDGGRRRRARSSSRRDLEPRGDPRVPRDRGGRARSSPASSAGSTSPTRAWPTRIAGLRAGRRWRPARRHPPPGPRRARSGLAAARRTCAAACDAVGRAGLAYDLLVRARELPAALDVVRVDARTSASSIDHLAKPPIADRPTSALGRAASRRSRAPERLVQALGPGHRGRLGDVDASRDLAAGRRPSRSRSSGPARLIFGSDWPVCLLAAHVPRRRRHGARRSPPACRTPERAAIFGGTAERGLPAGVADRRRSGSESSAASRCRSSMQGRHALGGRADLEQRDARRARSFAGLAGRDHDPVADDALHRLLVVDRVAAGAHALEIGAERGHRRVRPGRRLGQDVEAVEPAIELGIRERRERGLAGRGRERRQAAPDPGRESHRLAAVVAGEVGHLEPVEHRELDGLLGGGRQRPGDLVELLDLVDGAEVGAAELREPPAEREPRPDPPDEPGVGEGAADVGDRRLRQAQAPGQLARADGVAAVSARTSRISAARVTAGARESGSASRRAVMSVMGGGSWPSRRPGPSIRVGQQDGPRTTY